MVNRKIHRLMESSLSAEEIVARLLEHKEVVAESHSTSDDMDEDNEEQEGW